MAEEKMPSVIEIAEKLRKQYIEKAAEVADSTDPEAVVKSVIDDLEMRKREVAMKLLGIDTSWGRHEVRQASVFQKYLDDKAHDYITAWLGDAIKTTLEDPNLKGKFMNDCRAAVRKQFKESVDWRIKRAVEVAVDNMKRDILNKVANEFREELGLPTKTADQEEIND